MDDHLKRIRVTAEQMQLMLDCIEDLRRDKLLKNPEVCRLLMESPIIQLQEMLDEQLGLIREVENPGTFVTSATAEP